MKEIKFKAWIVEDEVMIQSDRLCFEQFLPLKNLLNDNNDIQKIMQYTGLKDKNGVEIYEGDILQYDARFLHNTKPPLNDNPIGRIEATAGGFVFVRHCWWNDPFYPEMGEALADMQTKSWIQSNCEVIGNIYENPELLEDKQ